MLVVGVEGAALRLVARSEAEGSDPESWFIRRFECAALLVLGWILRDATREIDSVSYASESHAYVVVLPETDAHGAKAAAQRLSDLFERRSSVPLNVGVAAFPSDGLTVEDLFHHASSALDHGKSSVPGSAGLSPAEAAARGHASIDGSARNGHSRSEAPARTVVEGPTSSAAATTSLTAPVAAPPGASVGTSVANAPPASTATAASVDGAEGGTPGRRASNVPVIGAAQRDQGAERVMRRASNG